MAVCGRVWQASHVCPTFRPGQRGRRIAGRAAAASGATEVRIFSAKSYETQPFEASNKEHGFKLTPIDVRLSPDTVGLAESADIVCVFVNDVVNAAVLEALAASGTQCVALRCAGFNNVDLAAAQRLGIAVVRVPAYSPNAVAEHTLALILSLNRNIHRAYGRVRQGDCSLHGLVGFDMKGKTAGVIGTGRIGAIVARLLWHLRCNVVCYDKSENEALTELGCVYKPLDELLRESDIVTLNCPLMDETYHLIGEETIPTMKDGVMIVNTGRGPLVDAKALLKGLKSKKVGSVALDVYEEESDLFFQDNSDSFIADDVFARLLTFPNVLITAHQAFLTHEALAAIAEVTLGNVADVVAGRECENVVLPPPDADDSGK